MSPIKENNTDINQQLQAILDNSTDAIYLVEVTQDGRFIHKEVNNAYVEASGIPKNEIIGKYVDEFENEGIKEVLLRKYSSCLSAGVKTEFTGEYHLLDGVKIFHSILNPIWDESGRITHIMGVARDITEQKRMEEALQSNRNLLSAILESSPELITFALDTNYQYIAFDSKHTQIIKTMFGIDIAIGMNMLDVISSDADRIIAKESFDRALGGESFIVDEEYGDERLSRKYWQIYYAPIVSESGEIIGLTCFNIDITERKQQEKLLYKKEKEFRSLAENIPDNIARWDIEGRYLYINPTHEELLGISLEEIVGTFIPESHRTVKVKEGVLQVATTGETVVVRQEVVNDNGEREIHDVTITPEFDEDGNMISILGLGRDLTQMVRMQETLEKNSASLTEAQRVSKTGSWELNLKTNQLLWSEEIFRIFELDKDEFKPSYENFLYVIHPEDRDSVHQTFSESLAQQIPYEMEHRLLMSDGRVKYVQEKGETQYDANGNPVATIGIIHDITSQKIVEQLLQEALEFNEEVINTIPDLLFEIDRDGTYLNVWAHDENLLVDQKSVLLGNNIKDILSKENVELSFQAMDEVDEKGISSGNIFQLDTPDGKKWFEFSTTKKKSTGTYLTLSRDITTRRVAKENLEKTKAKLSAVISTIPDLIWVKDTNGVYKMCNPAFEYFFDTLEEKIIGKTDYDFFESDAADMCKQSDLEAISSNQLTISYESFIYPDTQKIGIWEIRKIPVTMPDGEAMGILGLAKDVTESKNQEELLRKKEVMFRSLAENSIDPIIRYDRDGRRIYVNPVVEKLTGIPASQLLGKTPTQEMIIPSNEALRIEEAIQKVVSAGEQVMVNLLVVGPDEKEYYLEANHIPEFDKDGEVMSILSISHDITAMVQQEELLYAVSEAQQELQYKNELMKSILESSRDVAIYALDNRYCYLSFNEAHKEYCSKKWEKEIDIGMNFFDMIEDNEEKKFYKERFELVFEGEESSVVSEEKVLVDGVMTSCYWDTYASPVYDAKKEVIGLTMFSINITQRKQMEREIIQNEIRFKEAQKIAKIGSWELEFPGLRLHWSDEVYRIFELTPGNWEPSFDHFLNVVHPEERVYVDNLYLESFQTKIPFDTIHRLLMKDGRIKYIHVRGETFYNQNGTLLKTIGTIQDVSERKLIEKRMEYMAHHDALSGLPNRVLIKDRAIQIIERAKRYDKKVALLFVDLDGFKTINDTFGHSVGDILLKNVASRLQGCIRASDTISRQGGDEFLIILPDIVDEEDVKSIADKLINDFKISFNINDNLISTSASIGVAFYPEHGTNFEQLLQSADAAMYKAKETGKNTYCFYSQQMKHNLLGIFKMQNDLKSAILNGEFILYYQPQIDLKENKIVGVEALVRWNHPELGLVPPMSFIPIAESTGLIVPIGEWIIKEACSQAAVWNQEGKELVIAVNISAVQFQRGNLLEVVKDTLKISGLSAKYLELELTESLLINDTENVLETVKTIKELGVQLSIDDFGTGYSSLAYLKRFAVDKLKIDQSFVRDILNDKDDATIVKTIIQMAKSFNLKTIAEGVEDKEVLDVIKEFGCEEVQGYYFAKPMCAEDFEQYQKEFCCLI
jgi:diguanylate cyclase (GGDEF)-like protein/PAS domain S-box-containing protein